MIPVLLLAAALCGHTVSASAADGTFSGTTTTVVRNTGVPCVADQRTVAEPYSAVYVDGTTGNVTHIEYVGCDGVRSWTSPLPDSGAYVYQAYRGPVTAENVPAAAPAQGGGLAIILDAPGRVQVRNGYTGALLASYPDGGDVAASYTVPAVLVRDLQGTPVVVDVMAADGVACIGTQTVIVGR